MNAKRWHRTFLLSAFTLALPSAIARADVSSSPSILLHVAATTTKNTCSGNIISSCDQIVTHSGLGNRFVYLLVSRSGAPDIAGLECSITYDNDCVTSQRDSVGLDIFSWHLCADVEFPSTGVRSWPDALSSNIIAWDSTTHCQTGALAVAGYFYVGAYSPGKLLVLPRQGSESNFAKVADCGAREYWVSYANLGFVQFSLSGSTPGCNPCRERCTVDSARPAARLASPAETPAGIFFHLKPASISPSCSASEILSDCASAMTQGAVPASGQPGIPYYVYVMVESSGAVGSLDCGITYGGGLPSGLSDNTGLDIMSWNSCYPGFQYMGAGWPAPGGVNRMYWYSASSGLSVPGYFYVSSYGDDTLRVTPRFDTGTLQVGYCNGSTHNVTPAERGYAVFSANASVPGCNPCVSNCSLTAPVKPASWSDIKSLYR